MSESASRWGDEDAKPGKRPVYSIGAVARMLGVDAATLRAWEERYVIVIPTRSRGGQRVYSRDDLEQLRFVVREMEEGSSAGDAHRLLDEERRAAEIPRRRPTGDTTVVILLAERDRYAAEAADYLLRTEGYDVCSTFDPISAERLFVDRAPDLSVVELMISGGGLELCGRLARGGQAPVLAVSALDIADDALAVGASAFLAKPIDPLQFVSTVRDLLGQNALMRPSRVKAW